MPSLLSHYRERGATFRLPMDNCFHRKEVRVGRERTHRLECTCESLGEKNLTAMCRKEMRRMGGHIISNSGSPLKIEKTLNI